MSLSKQQQAYVDTAVSGGNVIASATAGAGKTFVLAETANNLTKGKTGVAVTFSKPLADELQVKLPPHIQGKTIHSLAYSTVAKALKASGNKGKLIVDGLKYRRLFRQYVNDESEFEFWVGELDNVQHMTLKLEELVKHIEETYGKYASMLIRVIQEGILIFHEEGKLTYTDMVWYPVLLGFDAHAWKNSVIMLDESQDVSELYMKTILMHSYKNSQILAVGDAQQTVHSWNGIPLNRFSVIRDELKAKQIRFHKTYRLPSTVVDLLYSLNLTDDIETESNREGSVSEKTIDYLLNNAKPGDMVLSRFHASQRGESLLSVGLALLQRGIPIRYVRYNPMDNIEAFVKFCKAEHRGTSVQMCLPLWESHLIDIVISRGNKAQDIDKRILHAKERALSVKIHLDLYKGHNQADFLAFTKNIYNRNNADSAVILSSAHASKGLESKNVYIVNPEQFMLTRPSSTADDYVAEANVMFVALTRTKDNLYFIGNQPEKVSSKYLAYYS